MDRTSVAIKKDYLSLISFKTFSSQNRRHHSLTDVYGASLVAQMIKNPLAMRIQTTKSQQCFKYLNNTKYMLSDTVELNWQPVTEIKMRNPPTV